MASFTLTIEAGQTSGSAPFTLTPVDDTVVEGDESISVSGTATELAVNGTSVTLTDDDEATVRVADAQAVEGETMTFTATLDHAVRAGFTVRAVFTDGTATEGADYRGSTAALSFAGTAGETHTITVPTLEDERVEGDETFALRLSVTGALPGVGGSHATGTIADDDREAVRVEVTVADATAEEGSPLYFTVTLDRAHPDEVVTMRYATGDGTARAGEDYEAASGTLTFAPGESYGTVEVRTLDDALDEGSETMALRLSDAVNAVLSDPEATGTLTNNDKLPAAWIARYGRTVARHVMDAVDDRLHGGVSEGTHLSIAGMGVPLPGSGDAPAWPGGTSPVSSVRSGVASPAGLGASTLAGSPRGGPEWDGSTGEGPAGGAEREMTARELLAQTSFRRTFGASEDPWSGSGARWTAWGSGASTHFDGRDESVSLEGDVVGFTLGLDRRWDEWTAGMALAYSDGKGSYDDAKSGDRGTLGSTLASVHPYLRWSNERLSVWGMLGYGWGEYAVEPERLAKTIRTDLGMNMVGAGARRDLATAEKLGGVELALHSDAMFVGMSADAVPGYLRETSTRTSHVRVLLEGSRAFELGSGAVLTPSLEVGPAPRRG